jgi:hypothetical protein
MQLVAKLTRHAFGMLVNNTVDTINNNKDMGLELHQVCLIHLVLHPELRSQVSYSLHLLQHHYHHHL